MPPLTPTPVTVALKDIPPLPIFAYTPSLWVWVGLLLIVLLLGWLVGRSPHRSAQTPPPALDAIEAEVARLIARGAPCRDGLFSISRAIKVLLRARGLGDFTAATPGELATGTGPAGEASLGRLLAALGRIDELKYQPDTPTSLEHLTELRRLLRPALTPPPSSDGGKAP
jgi:hypothetical protein